MAGLSPPLKPFRPITLSARPFLFITTFIVVHQTIATGSLPPAYYFFQTTGSSTSLLAGPYAAFVLRQHIPLTNKKVEDVVEDVMRGTIGSSWKLWGMYRGKDQKVEDKDSKKVAKETIEGLEGRRRLWTNKALDKASGVKLQQVMDAAAAYLVVKALFPLRLAVSLYLTPKIARTLARRGR
ncbi:hypothetical protein FRB96_000791 [Tulasnella sp. 330]|nr:hypothetical protein FRB96_000791 [Tulasnella sp. 330]KAG8882521.1 hypothetical protein FRB97_008147 [Tulasnella sp. 331]KAG8888855.1 hypothetical protein FRB98_006641 [Tulasnella sp. 332]